jgi:hypothetical protein
MAMMCPRYLPSDVGVILWPVQCVACPGGSVSVGSTVWSISVPAADAGRAFFIVTQQAGDTFTYEPSSTAPYGDAKPRQISSSLPQRFVGQK